MRLAIAALLCCSLVVLASGCSGDGGGTTGDSTGDNSQWRKEDGAGGGSDNSGNSSSPAFAYDGSVCKITAKPYSAVTTKVEVTIPLLDAFAELLAAEGYDVYRGPGGEAPVDGPDIVSPPEDVRNRESVDQSDLDQVAVDAAVADVVAADLPTEPVWTGGEYLLARTALSDMLFVFENGTFGIVSWCPAHSLGQIRRLDYALADGVRLWGKLAAFDYVTETESWIRPVAYYTSVAGSYQRTYMNDSLAIDERHTGQISISGIPTMAGFALYGHADKPSQVGDVVGMDLLQVGQKVLAENDSVTVSGQVARLWDFTPLAGEGELPVIIDAFVADESINWQTGRYLLFADVIFPDKVSGSFVLSLQGAPPGKLIISKAIGTLALPPFDDLFYQ